MEILCLFSINSLNMRRFLINFGFTSGFGGVQMAYRSVWNNIAITFQHPLVHFFAFTFAGGSKDLA